MSGNPFFLASILTAYPQQHNLDDTTLAAVLGCSLDVLTGLRLCRSPGAALPGRSVVEDVAEVSGRFRVDAEALLRVVREGEEQP